MAKVLGKSHPYSESLRSGLVESIAHIAVSNVPIAGREGQRIADSIVQELLGTGTGQSLERLLSLAAFLPDLAEASPESFLGALDAVTRDSTTAKKIFLEGGIFSWSPHVYVLWALERLAWSEDHFSRVVLTLGNLAAIDPGGNLANRPSRSLIELLLPWHPQTTVSVRHRLDAIDLLHEKHESVAWNLVVKLLPGEVNFVSSVAHPQWRNWKPDELPPAAAKEDKRAELEEFE